MRTLALRAAAVVLLLAAVGLATVSISRVAPLRVRLTNLDGEPLTGAFLAYRYKGYRFNFVDSLTYYRPGEVVRTDDAGQFEIRGFLELHPPLDSGLAPWIEWVYVPELHHFFGPIGARSESRPGRVEIDWEQGVLRFADLGEDPVGWSRTIGDFEQEVQPSHAETARGEPRYVMPDVMRETLNVHLREELRAFMKRHATTPRVARTIPNHRGMGEEERAARDRAIGESLEREPFWGQLMRRRWPELATSG